jgi:adenylate cyclase
MATLNPVVTPRPIATMRRLCYNETIGGTASFRVGEEMHKRTSTSVPAHPPSAPRGHPRWIAWLEEQRQALGLFRLPLRLTRPQRQLRQAALTGLSVAAFLLLLQWAGLFSSAQQRAADYLYRTEGHPGTDIVIVAIDEKSQQALGEWPWSLDHYVRLFQRIEGASAIGLDVLLTDASLQNDRYAPALLDAVRRCGNVVVPVAALELAAPESDGELYRAGQTVQTFPALREAAAAIGSVNQILDRDGTLRRVPLLIDRRGSEPWHAFGLQILRLYLGLNDDATSFVRDRVRIQDQEGILYEVPTDANGAMLIRYVGATHTFSTPQTYYSFVDVVQDRAPGDAFEDKIVLVGMMNTLTEMDIHTTPVSPLRMAGIEVQANIIHTLLNHRALVPASRTGETITVLLLSLTSALALSQLGAIAGIAFTALLALGYFVYTGLQFDAGVLPNVLYPYGAILINYAALMAARFTSERVERGRVTETFGRFVSPQVRDAIVQVALENPDLIQPGGRQIEISVLFADIRGFTTLAESLPPSDVVDILNRYLDSMEDQVFRQSGTLDKYTGDGMMVLFGAPLEQPDHAARAVRAALGMQRAASEIRDRQPIDGESDTARAFVYGVGIATGQAVVGHIGSRRRLDYTAIGDTVNLASRLEGVAPPGTILISKATYEQVRDVVIAEQLEPVQVKGKAKPVPVYKLLALRREDDDDNNIS